MRLTEEEYLKLVADRNADHAVAMERRKISNPVPPQGEPSEGNSLAPPKEKTPPTGQISQFAVTTPSKPKMNKLESDYSQLLDHRKRTGEILDWRFEAITLKLGFDTRYTPDFMVINCKCEIEFHETKGFMRDDANVKIKIAAGMFPFRFILVKKEQGELTFKEIKR